MIKEFSKVTGPYLNQLLASTEAAAVELRESIIDAESGSELARITNDLINIRANQSRILEEQGKRFSGGIEKLSQDIKHREGVIHGK